MQRAIAPNLNNRHNEEKARRAFNPGQGDAGKQRHGGSEMRIGAGRQRTPMEMRCDQRRAGTAAATGAAVGVAMGIIVRTGVCLIRSKLLHVMIVISMAGQVLCQWSGDIQVIIMSVMGMMIVILQRGAVLMD